MAENLIYDMIIASYANFVKQSYALVCVQRYMSTDKMYLFNFKKYLSILINVKLYMLLRLEYIYYSSKLFLFLKENLYSPRHFI